MPQTGELVISKEAYILIGCSVQWEAVQQHHPFIQLSSPLQWPELGTENGNIPGHEFTGRAASTEQGTQWDGCLLCLLSPAAHLVPHDKPGDQEVQTSTRSRERDKSTCGPKPTSVP